MEYLYFFYILNKQNVLATKCGNIPSITKVEVGGYVILKGLTGVTKPNGKLVKIVAYVEKQWKWKVKLLQAEQEMEYLGVTSKHLDPIKLIWSCSQCGMTNKTSNEKCIACFSSKCDEFGVILPTIEVYTIYFY